MIKKEKGMKIRNWVALSVLLFVTVACTIAPTPQANEDNIGEEIRCEEGGYTLKIIPGYEASPGIITGSYNLDSKDIDYGDPNFVVGEGPQILLYGVVPDTGITFEKFVKNGNNDMRSRLNATISGEPQITVAGLVGAAFDYDYELAGAGKMKARDISVEVNPGQWFSIQCRSTIEKWDKTLADCDAVINSITFFEPVPSTTQIP
jgi:hypothetical protein